MPPSARKTECTRLVQMSVFCPCSRKLSGFTQQKERAVISRRPEVKPDFDLPRTWRLLFASPPWRDTVLLFAKLRARPIRPRYCTCQKPPAFYVRSVACHDLRHSRLPKIADATAPEIIEQKPRTTRLPRGTLPAFPKLSNGLSVAMENPTAELSCGHTPHGDAAGSSAPLDNFTKFTRKRNGTILAVLADAPRDPKCIAVPGNSSALESTDCVRCRLSELHGTVFLLLAPTIPTGFLRTQ
jgi:hypothetical protein